MYKLKWVQTKQTPSFMKSQNDFPYALLLLIPAYFCYLAISRSKKSPGDSTKGQETKITLDVFGRQYELKDFLVKKTN